MTRLVVPLTDVAEADPALVGGKARSLGVLAAAGFRVPTGFALTTRGLVAFLEGAGLTARQQEIDATLRRGELPPDDALAAFRDAIRAAALPPALLRVVTATILQGFCDPDVAVAVRSSGTREDLEGASFAGQYESVLGVRGEGAILRAIRHCWASMWEPRVLEYAQNRGGGADGLGMCVVVQELIEADVAGVMFTVNPVTGREEEIVVEAVLGLGESHVSGRVTADRYVVDAERLEVVSEALAHQAFRVVSTASGGTEEQPLDEGVGGARTLTSAHLAALARLAGDVQEHYGRPMDIEWAIDDGALWVLQARPITRIAFAPEVGEWTTADFRDGGVSSDVCSPFMWSLYEYAIENSMPAYFKDLRLVPRDHEATWGRMFFARPYWNLGEVKRAIGKLPGYSEEGFHADLGVAVEPGFVGQKTPTTAMGILRALPTLFALTRCYEERLAYNRSFVAAFPARKEPFDKTPDQIAALDRNTFVAGFDALLTTLYRDTESGYFYTIYNTSNSKIDLTPVFEKVNAAAGGVLDEPTLLSGLKNLSHLRPMKDLHQVAGEIVSGARVLDEAVVAAFAHRWRHHGRKELDIRVPRWIDDHEFVRQMIQGAVDAYDPEHDLERMEEEHHASFVAARDRALAAIRWRPLLRRSFLQKLERVRTYAWWREEMRDYSSFAYYLVRLWSLDAARRLAEDDIIEASDDLWYLPFADVIASLKGTLAPDEVRRRVGRGRRLVRAFRNFDNPNEIGSHFRAPEGGLPAPDDALRGTPCSPGRVTARACVVRTLDEASRVEKGDILVTPFTDPGWTPLFARIAGVVTETGGVLSHAAVISREYGIPAVLAVSGAATVIRDGETISLDGYQGTVERVASA